MKSEEKRENRVTCVNIRRLSSQTYVKVNVDGPIE